MAKRVPVAEAKARFSAIVNEVLHDAEHYIVERRGQPVAAIVRVEDLERIETEGSLLPRPAGALALVGVWSDVEDAAIDAFLRDVFDARERDAGRAVQLEA
ncbi:MAG: type II toxin-antitoxin system Phd/YefM family antitoxin [Dehalococcoidia bacterium]